MEPSLMEAGTWVALAAFSVNMIGTIVGVTWKLSRVEISLRDAIMQERKEIDSDIERQAREFGETVAALRTKVHEVEVWARDTFMRRDGLHEVKADLSDQMKGIAAQINGRLDKLEAKIEARQ